MCRATRFLSLLAAGSLCIPGVALGQAEQVLKDAWAASGLSLFQIKPLDRELSGPLNPVSTEPGDPDPDDDEASRDFRAIAFEAPDLNALNAVRNLLAVDDTKILRYANGDNEGIDNPELLLDASDRTGAGLNFVNTVAADTNSGAVLFSGYSRRKRRFELWQIADPSAPTPEFVTAGMPQLTDAVYIDSSETGNLPSYMTHGGLLAVSSREVLFFTKDASGSWTNEFVTVVDVRSLPVRNNTSIVSADIVRDTNFLVLALSTREAITYDLSLTLPVSAQFQASIGLPEELSSCGDDRSQLFRIRFAGIVGNDGQSVLTDACGQVSLHHLVAEALPGETISYTTFVEPLFTTPSDSSLLALAVGEGNRVICEPNEPCLLTEGYTANIETDQTAELLVLKINDLCDPRVNVAAGCYDGSSGELVLNDLLPPALQDALDVSIVIPSSLFAATNDARFGAVFVKADDASRTALSTAILTLDGLLNFEGLGVATRANSDLSRATAVVELLNNDVVAYAPDDPALPTVRGFEATPVTVDEGSVVIRKRGYSVDIYGLMHDVDAPSGRGDPDGGIVSLNTAGEIPGCGQVTVGGQTYTSLAQPVAGDQNAISTAQYQQAYFLNLTACLFQDLQSLIEGTDPVQAAGTFAEPFRSNLIQQFELLGDKLIKALNAAVPNPEAGPNQGETNLQSTVVQLNQFYELLLDSPVNPAFANAIVYKNDLIVRTEVLRFNLLERTDPSLDFVFE